MRLKQSDRKDVHDRAVIKLAKELLAPIEKQLSNLAEMLWEHHCGDASRKVLEAGIDPRFYVTTDTFSPEMQWSEKNESWTTLRQWWRAKHNFSDGAAITKSGNKLTSYIDLTCKLPERRPAPVHLSYLKCETAKQRQLVKDIFSDLEKVQAEAKKFSKQVDELLNSVKTLDQLKELSPALAEWVDVPEPKKHLPMPVETANAVNATLNKLAAA